MSTLFGEDLEEDSGAPAVKLPGPYAGVALENALDHVLDYSIPKKLIGLVRVGQRVKVPLGRNNRPAFGYVVRIQSETDYPKIKALSQIVDERVLVGEELMELARWMSRYYCSPLGTVLDNIIPSAVKKKIGVDYGQLVRVVKSVSELQGIFEKTRPKKRRAILARLLQLKEDESIEIHRLAEEAGSTAATVRKLVRLGVISISSEPEWSSFPQNEYTHPSGGLEKDLELNEEQRKVFDRLAPRLGAGFSVNLLFGVTGSGKTEIYLQALRKVLENGKQAIVLVPEIALTPQTVRRFTSRFGRVAILHSGLSAGQRHRYWHAISTGKADVVVGARSAVFAPLPNLGMIVVDEEHESSYKQDTAPRYHARDVAIKRAQLVKVPVLLGSATPSLESWERAQATEDRRQGTVGGENYLRPRFSPALLELPNRVKGLALPHVELIDMKQDRRFRKGIHLISQRLEHLLRFTLESKHQAILLLNRRGYSNFIYCVSCQEPVHCKYCDTTMTYHRSASVHGHGASHAEGVHTGQMHCHYCLAVAPLPEKCPACGHKLSLFGLGTQRVEEELTRKFPELKYARVDSDTMRSAKDYEQLLSRFAAGEIQVMLGTQMIAKGLDYPNVTLVGVVSGDTALALPDFRASERTFQLITQVAGRAGRGEAPGRVVLQTFMPDDPTIRDAIKQDFPGFAKRELGHRKELMLPPYSRMVRIILRDQEQDKLHKLSEKLAADLTAAIEAEMEIPKTAAVIMKGPMPCPISRIAGYFRNQIVLSSLSATALQKVLARVREKGDLQKADRVAVDVDPVALL